MPDAIDPTREALAATVRAVVRRHGGPTAVGKVVGVHRTAIHRWMTGDIPLDALGDLAYKLGEPITVRFGPDDEKSPPESFDFDGLMRAVERIEATVLAWTPTERLIFHALEESETPSAPDADVPPGKEEPQAPAQFGSGPSPGQ